MSNLSSISYDIDSKLEKCMKEYEIRLEGINADILAVQDILSSPEAQTDRSENAVFSKASDDFQRLQIAMHNVMKTLDAFDHYKKSYHPMPYITVGATVHLQLDRGAKEEFFIKLVPEGLGVPDIGAIGMDTALGIAIYHKKQGDNVVVKNKNFTIKEVY